MLAIGIRYLNGFSVASEADSRERPEWPPHPARVFMALAAAYFETGGDAAEREALLWLEGSDASLGPPAIRAGQVQPRRLVEQYVPVNDEAIWKAGADNKSPPPPLQSAPGIIRERNARAFARAWLSDDTAYLVWPDAQPSEKICHALESLCAKVTRIGHSTSLVQVWLAAPGEVREPDWVPDAARPALHLRVPVPGTLCELERRFSAVGDGRGPGRARLRPEVRSYHGYAPRSLRAELPFPPGTVFSPHMLVHTLARKEGRYRRLDVTRTLAVAQGWRDALLSSSNDLSSAARSILSGHDCDGKPLGAPHLAIAPLPFVGSPHADGHLLGMAVALPGGLPTGVRREVLRAVGRVEELRLGRLGVWRLGRDLPARPPWNLRAEVWSGYSEGAALWATVTPIAFDRHPKAKDLRGYLKEASEMIAEACGAIGLPRPAHVVVTGVSPHLGVPPAHSFPRLRRKDGGERRHAHALLAFDRPVCGPVLLGAGRYRGYGACRPVLSEEPE